MFCQEAPGLSHTGEQLQRTALNEALQVALRRQACNAFEKRLGCHLCRQWCVRRRRASFIVPDARDVRGDHVAQFLPLLDGLGPKVRQNTIDLIQVHTELLQLGLLGIVSGMCRGDQQPEYQRGNRGDQAEHELDEIFGIALEML